MLKSLEIHLGIDWRKKDPARQLVSIAGTVTKITIFGP